MIEIKRCMPSFGPNIEYDKDREFYDFIIPFLIGFMGPLRRNSHIWFSMRVVLLIERRRDDRDKSFF